MDAERGPIPLISYGACQRRNSVHGGGSSSAAGWRERRGSPARPLTAVPVPSEPAAAFSMPSRPYDLDLEPPGVDTAIEASSVTGSQVGVAVSSSMPSAQGWSASEVLAELAALQNCSVPDMLAEVASIQGGSASESQGAGANQGDSFRARVSSPPHGSKATSNDTVAYAMRHGYESLGIQKGTIDEDSDVDGWVSPLSRAAVSRTSDVLSAGCANDSFMARVSSPPTGPDATSNAAVAFSIRHGFPCLAQTLGLGSQDETTRSDSSEQGRFVSPLGRTAISRITNDEADESLRRYVQMGSPAGRADDSEVYSPGTTLDRLGASGSAVKAKTFSEMSKKELEEEACILAAAIACDSQDTCHSDERYPDEDDDLEDDDFEEVMIEQDQPSVLQAGADDDETPGRAGQELSGQWTLPQPPNLPTNLPLNLPPNLPPNQPPNQPPYQPPHETTWTEMLAQRKSRQKATGIARRLQEKNNKRKRYEECLALQRKMGNLDPPGEKWGSWEGLEIECNMPSAAGRSASGPSSSVPFSSGPSSTGPSSTGPWSTLMAEPFDGLDPRPAAAAVASLNAAARASSPGSSASSPFDGLDSGPAAAAGISMSSALVPRNDSSMGEHMASTESFSCKCPVAVRHGCSSCLDTLSPYVLRGIRALTYGTGSSAESLTPMSMRSRLHSAMWALPRELIHEDGSLDQRHRQYRIPRWELTSTDGKSHLVCRKAWRQAMGGSSNAHDDMYALVLRGRSPVEVEASQSAKTIVSKSMDLERDRRGDTRRDYCIGFWVSILRVCDWMPNDQKLVLRGPGYTFYHSNIYGPSAKKAGVFLHYKSFRSYIPAALRIVALELPECDPNKLRFGRSERHSKFPECSKCQETRLAYLAARSDPGSTPEWIDECRVAMVTHQAEWQADREFALNLRRAHFLKTSNSLYECDDKCGSFWQCLPVVPGGRQSKSTVSRVYRFAIQSNTICGEDGVLRFSFVPKNVCTGSNFGLTNLFMALKRAKDKGLLGRHVKRLIRHTDGGSDNVSRITHFLHWLLVYVGVFDDLLWFRFEAGHSHTEIADRFFSLIKRLFDTDAATRVSRPVQSFAELEQILLQKFEAFPEQAMLEFNFTNWDFDGWFRDLDNDLAKSAEAQFSRFTFDTVFNYEYVGPALALHGGVKVTFKDRLSRTGSYREAEWLPINTVTDNSGQKRNVTQTDGVVFVKAPPDLRNGPVNEAFSEVKEDIPGTVSKNMARSFPFLDGPSQDDWAALSEMHNNAAHSGAFPDLPHTLSFTSRGSTKQKVFHGTPMPFKPILESLKRFDRPLITWNIFEEAPPSQFPLNVNSGGAEGSDVHQEKPIDTPQDQLRDPREHNRVTHLGFTKADYNKVNTTLTAEQWIEGSDNRIHESHWDDKQGDISGGGGLYVVRLEEADGEFYLGLGRDFGESSDKTCRIVQWYGRCSKSHAWPVSVKFDSSKWNVRDSLSKECFLIEIDEEGGPNVVTPSSTTDKPYLAATFLKRLRLFAVKYELCKKKEPVDNPKPKGKEATGKTTKATTEEAIEAEQPVAKAKPKDKATGKRKAAVEKDLVANDKPTDKATRKAKAPEQTKDLPRATRARG